MLRIVVLNPKGGRASPPSRPALPPCTRRVATGRSSWTSTPRVPASRWLEKRSPHQPPIHGIAAYARALGVTRSFQLRVPHGTDRVIVDTPAAMHPHDFNEHVRDADAVLVPVMPSDADIHACSRTIGHLLISGKIKRRENRLAVVANRVKPNTIIFRTLMRFLDQMQIPVVTTLRDSQHYVYANEQGLGLHDMNPARVHPELQQWDALWAWLESRKPFAQPAVAVGLT